MNDPTASDSYKRTSACTCLRLRKATRQVTQIYDQHLAAYGLTVTQFSLLGHLRTLAGISIGDLAEIMVMDPTSLTRTLRPLERGGLVKAETDRNDRRTRRLSLTSAGAEAYVAARPGWQKAQAQLQKALGPSGAPELNAVLDHLLSRLTMAPG